MNLHTSARLQIFNDEEEILKVAIEKREINFRETAVGLRVDVVTAAMECRKSIMI